MNSAAADMIVTSQYLRVPSTRIQPADVDGTKCEAHGAGYTVGFFFIEDVRTRTGSYPASDLATRLPPGPACPCGTSLLITSRLQRGAHPAAIPASRNVQREQPDHAIGHAT
jgi:hypothetical protein